MEIVNLAIKNLYFWYILISGRPVPQSTSLRGSYGEWLAVRFLRRKKYKLIKKNWRSCRDRRMELDIVCIDQKCLVFVEVRTRSSASFVTPWQSFSRSKRKSFKTASSLFLKENNMNYQNFRYDFVEIDIDSSNLSKFQVRHHENIAI